MRDLAAGKVRLVYVSPERLVRDNALRTALASRQLGALVVDEAHCVSAWGHDFRPEFRQVVKPLLTFERSPRMGLTATATPEVERDLERTLRMADPVVVRAPVDRPDLRYAVHAVADDRERTRELLRFIAFQGEKPGIVYASRRALTEELAWIIRQTGVTARAYHAGMVPEQRDAVQDDFLAGTTQVIVATKAFGMGVNKQDIGWVVHFDLPESLEAYAQESGRAARRAELHGDCLLFLSRRDIVKRRKQAGTTSADLRKAQQLLDLVAITPTRGDAHLVDPDELSERLSMDPEELNVLLAWLEQVGAVERQQDATVRASVEVGRREPKDRDEQREFVDLVKFRIKARPGARRLFELADVAEEAGIDPDQLERRLVDWSLGNFLSFSSTQRAWRVELKRSRVDEIQLRNVVRNWQAMEKRRVDDIVRYAESRTCRRRAIAAVFGDPETACGPRGGLPCDVCSSESPFWHAFPLSRVPDPEDLVDVELVVLQAVRWTTRGRDAGRAHRYSEANLKAALCGNESIGQRPLPPALFNCPQFGALRYVRAKDRRVTEAVESLLGEGAIERETTNFQGRAYTTLTLTDTGRATLGGAA
jgi:ATP-dependent DNA helicase RecQ